MRRPEFNFGNLDPRRLYNEYTSNLDPQLKPFVNFGLGTALATPIVAGVVDANSGPTHAYNSNENLTNMGLTAMVPATAIGAGYLATRGIQDPQKYADGRVPHGMNEAYQAIYGEDVGNREYQAHRGEYVSQGLKKRNTRAAFGATLIGLGTGIGVAGQMMDEYPTVANSLSMQDKQEIQALLGANGAL